MVNVLVGLGIFIAGGVCGYLIKFVPYKVTEQEIVCDETNLFTKEEVYHDCTVEVWMNEHTGETSVGWYKNA